MELQVLGTAIRLRRQVMGLTQHMLAERAGLSVMAVSAIERGRSNPRVSSLFRIAAELELSLDDLIFEKPIIEEKSDG